MTGRTGVLVMAHGTPDTPEEIEAFYTRIRRGRPPTPELLDELTGRYEAIGGTSPLTGRTHQLRVHAASEGWPILGDPIYGEGKTSGASLQLLERRVEVPISKNKPPVIAQAPAPEHMREALAACGFAVDPERVTEVGDE